jgi:hypothetical protein
MEVGLSSYYAACIIPKLIHQLFFIGGYHNIIKTSAVNDPTMTSSNQDHFSQPSQ